MTPPAYQVVIYWSDDDTAFIAEVPELPGAMADGATRQEALANAESVINEWIETAQESGRPVPSPGRKLLTIPEAAEQLGLSIAMVRRYCKTEKLPAQKVGRDWAVRQRDLERFAASPRKRGRKSANFR
ncbi:MAG TPA: type II toxin-antitoxin system HicB family antitoxin [Anaerolineaceae bacterium]|nr:type II toxin-antitoxin system HicB family antitoxin [Anaerolineaceae bacterium]